MIMSYLFLQLGIIPFTVEIDSMPPSLFHYVVGPFESFLPRSLLCCDICSRKVEFQLAIMQPC